MSKIIEVTDLSPSRPGSLYAPDEAQLRSRLEPEKGVFIAESPKVIGTALDAGLEPVSLLMERRHVEGQARGIIARCGEIPVCRRRQPSGGLDRLPADPRRPVRHAPASAARRGGGVRRKTADSCPGEYSGRHQHRRDFPLCRCAGYGCSPGDPRLLRSVEQARRKGQHGRCFPSALDLYRQ